MPIEIWQRKHRCNSLQACGWNRHFKNTIIYKHVHLLYVRIGCIWPGNTTETCSDISQILLFGKYCNLAHNTVHCNFPIYQPPQPFAHIFCLVYHVIPSARLVRSNLEKRRRKAVPLSMVARSYFAAVSLTICADSKWPVTLSGAMRSLNEPTKFPVDWTLLALQHRTSLSAGLRLHEMMATGASRCACYTNQKHRDICTLLWPSYVPPANSTRHSSRSSTTTITVKHWLKVSAFVIWPCAKI